MADRTETIRLLNVYASAKRSTAPMHRALLTAEIDSQGRNLLKEAELLERAAELLTEPDWAATEVKAPGNPELYVDDEGFFNLGDAARAGYLRDAMYPPKVVPANKEAVNG